MRPAAHRALTQAELLAEAARTEIDNAKSLQALVAMEEESKRRAAVKSAKYAGPMLRLLSRAVDGEERVRGARGGREGGLQAEVEGLWLHPPRLLVKSSQLA